MTQQRRLTRYPAPHQRDDFAAGRIEPHAPLWPKRMGGRRDDRRGTRGIRYPDLTVSVASLQPSAPGVPP